MARARNIKPGFFKNEDLAECSVFARLLFPGLWMLADRDGRLEDRPKRIKGEIFPFDSVEVDPLLQELAHWGFIKRYVADEKRCIEISNFVIHQNPHGTEKDSDLPDQQGLYNVNERAKNGCITGKTWHKDGKSTPPTVKPQLDNSESTVKPQLDNVAPLFDNALNPESCILNPESNTPHTPQGGLLPVEVEPEQPSAVAAECTDPAEPTVAIVADKPVTTPPPGEVRQLRQRKPRDAGAVSFADWLAAEKLAGRKPIPEDDTVFDYAKSAGIPDEMLSLVWAEFRARYRENSKKRYTDWRAVFRNAVRGNWFKLWFFDETGAYRLTTAGRQAEAVAA